MVWLVNMADTDGPKRNSTEGTAASPQPEAQEGEQCVKVIEWGLTWRSPFKWCPCSLDWLFSLVCSRIVPDSLRSVAGRWRLHPQLGQPAAAPAGDAPVHRTVQAGDPGDAHHSSRWRGRWGEWVLRAEHWTFWSFSQSWCVKKSTLWDIIGSWNSIFSYVLVLYLNYCSQRKPHLFNMPQVSKAVWLVESSVHLARFRSMTEAI